MATTLDRRPLTPTPADPVRVLLAGGPADVARELKAWGAPRGLRVTNAWPSERGKAGAFDRPIPTGTDLVILLVTYLGHDKQAAVIASCKRAGVRFVRSAWNRTKLVAALAAAGIRLAEPRSDFDPKPLHEEPEPPARPARCAFTEGGRRCQVDAAADDTLCAAHRARFDASRSSPPLRVGGEKPTLCLVPPQLSADAVAAIAAVAAVAPDGEPRPTPTNGAALTATGLGAVAAELVDVRAAAVARSVPPPERVVVQRDDGLRSEPAPWGDGFVRAPSKAEFAWAPAHVEHLTRLVETGTTDAAKLVSDLYAATGVYRPAGGLAIFLRPLVAVGVKARDELLVDLGRLAKAQTVARRAADVAEATELKHGRTPDLLSRDAAARLVGGVANRLEKLEFRLETATGRLVYRRDDVLARKAELEARAGGALDGTKLNPAPKTDEATLERRVRDALSDGHGWGVCTLAKLCHVDRDRVDAVLKRLQIAGEAVATTRSNRPADELIWGPPGFVPAPAKLPTRLKNIVAEAVATVPTPVASSAQLEALADVIAADDNAFTQPAPVATVAEVLAAVTPPPADPVVAAVIDAINSGRLDAAKGAAVLTALRSKP